MELKDYREVAERIAEWYERHPDGRIVPEVLEWTDVRVMVKASAYRGSSSDELPAGVGHSYLAIPGATSFTKGSELENAETSAAGRALVMAGIPSKAVASDDEVETKKASQDSEPGTGEPAGSVGKAAPGSPPLSRESKVYPEPLTPEEEQQNAYIQVLRDGPGNTQSVLMARKLYETQVRKVRVLRDLDLNELVGVIQAFREKVEAPS